jgi:hypothetical protein
MTSMMVVSAIGTPSGCTFFRETFFALVRLGFAERFFDAGLAVDRFAAFPRAGLEALRDLPRTVDRLLLDVACSFRRAIVAAYAVGLRRIPVQYWPNFESKPACRSPRLPAVYRLPAASSCRYLRGPGSTSNN